MLADWTEREQLPQSKNIKVSEKVNENKSHSFL